MKLYTKVLSILLVVLFTAASVSAHAHMTMDAANPEQLMEQQPSLLPDNMPLPMPNLIQGVFDEQINVSPDVSAITDPGNDPNAPIDAHLWLLLLLVAAFGAYQYKKQSTKTA
jgi:hypothetical protein